MNREMRRKRLKQPCHCGSGIAYKSCHYSRDRAVQKVAKIFRAKEKSRADFIQEHGHIRKPQVIQSGDRYMVAIGSDIFRQTAPGPYNFANVIHDYALHVFGDDFLEKEENKPLEKRHPAIQWLHISGDHHNAMLKRKDAKKEDFQFGLGAAWLRLAYDLYTIRDNADLTKEMRERLLDESKFQAARHELFVAALFVAAGFEINFEDEKNNKKRHPEFIAVDKQTGMRIAVEAKSKRRNGVKGFTGGHPFQDAGKVNVRSLVTDAYGKAQHIPEDVPLYVFVDTNLPPATFEQQEIWFQELNQTMNDLANEGYFNPCPAHAVFFHNDPSHFIERVLVRETDTLWIKPYVDTSPIKSHPNNIIERIMLAHQQRVSPPENIPDF